MPFSMTVRRLLHTAAALSVLLTLWSHLPYEWRAEALRRASELTLRTAPDVGAADLQGLSDLLDR